MELSKESVLHQTFYGVNIYSYILRQFYPGEIVLHVKGLSCGLAKNPFAGDKRTLEINIVKNCACHYDYSNAVPPGNVFDFAAFYYKLEGLKLLQKINEDLNLRIGEDWSFYNRSPKAKRLALECPGPSFKKAPEFSFFKRPISNVVPSKTITLTEVCELLRSDKYKGRTERLRAVADKNEARSFKAVSFDYVTFSGIFSKRSDKELVHHSGLMTIDFDHISNVLQLKKKLLADEYFETELLFTSPSGDGLKWIISVKLHNITHQDYFKAVAAYILNKYKLQVDHSGKDISRACFLPYDPDVYINPCYQILI